MTSIHDVLSNMMDLARENSPDARRHLCDRFVDMMDALDEEPSGSEWQIISDIYTAIVADVEKLIRARFAEELSHQSRPPRDLIWALCNDDIEIARPVLTKSRVLLDDDLVNIVTHKTSDYRIAVASRRNLPESVSDAVVSTGDVQALKTLLSNHSAKISEDTFHRIANLCASTRDIHEPFINRPDVPWRAVEKVVSLVSSTLLHVISERWNIPTTELISTAAKVREETAKEIAYRRSPDDISSQHRNKSIREMSDRSEQQIIRALSDGDARTARKLLAHWTGLSENIIQTVLNQEDMRLLATIYRSKGIDQLTFSRTVFALRGNDHDDHINVLRTVMRYYKELDQLKASALVKNWQSNPGRFNQYRINH